LGKNKKKRLSGELENQGAGVGSSGERKEGWRDG